MEPVSAQTSVYASVGLANFGFTHLTSDGSISFKGDTGGISGGALYDFPIQSRVKVGVDARFSGSPGNKGGVYGGAALRVAFVPDRIRLRPYFELGGGAVHSSYIETTVIYPAGISSPGTIYTQSNPITSGAAMLNFGLDVRLTPHYDLRAFELGAVAGGGNGMQAGTSYLNVGVVYHFHPAQRP